MKRIFFFTLLLIAFSASANETALESYIHAHQQMLKVQVVQLHSSISLLTSASLTDKDTFERIGQASFAAIDQTLKQAGFSVKTYYEFKANNEDAIRQWLSNHSVQAILIDSLQAEHDQLMKEYDQVIQATTDAN